MRRKTALWTSVVLASALCIAAIVEVVPAGTGPHLESDEEFELLGYFVGQGSSDVVLNGLTLRRIVSARHSVASAWVAIGSHGLRELGSPRGAGLVNFTLVSADGSRFPVLAQILPGEYGVNIASLTFRPGSGGRFVSPDLIAEIDGEEMARWPLADYPTDQRLIPADEPSVTRVDHVLGLSIEVSAERNLKESHSNLSTGWIWFWIDIKGEFGPHREYWVHYGVTETTWHKSPYDGMQGSLIVKPSKTGFGMAKIYAASADRLRIDGRVEQFDVYGEEAVFKGLTFVRNDFTGTLNLVNRESQTVVLSTGVRVVMPKFATPVLAAGKISGRSERLMLRFRIEFPEGVQGLSLPEAKDKLGSTEDVTLLIGRYSALDGHVGKGGRMISDERFLFLPILPNSVWIDRSFDLTVEVKHSAKVATAPIKFLVPVGEKQTSPVSKTPSPSQPAGGSGSAPQRSR